MVRILGYIILCIGAFSMLLPFLWMIILSFMNDSQIFNYPPQIFPNPATFDSYNNVFHKLPFLRFFMNSLFVATITTVLQVLFSSMAGYFFARFKFPCRDILFFMFLITMMVPPQVNIVPLFFVMREVGLVDTYQALILPGIFGGFGVFFMRQWFKSLSKEIEDAACIDGCSTFDVFFKIALPLSTPALITLALFTFITTWNSFLWPLIVTNSVEITTLPVAIAQFKGSFREVISWSDLMASSVVLTIPVVIVFLFGKKYLIDDILSGGIKE